MLLTLNVYCPQCNITNERQVDEARVQVDAEGNRRVRCHRCGGKAETAKPKRHDYATPAPDSTPHHEKNPIGGY